MSEFFEALLELLGALAELCDWWDIVGWIADCGSGRGWRTRLFWTIALVAAVAAVVLYLV